MENIKGIFGKLLNKKDDEVVLENTIKVDSPKAADNKRNAAGEIVGAGLLYLGVIMCVTIILIIPGIMFALIGEKILEASKVDVFVDCEKCGISNVIKTKDKRMECAGCGNTSDIKWIKEKGVWHL